MAMAELSVRLVSLLVLFTFRHVALAADPSHLVRNLPGQPEVPFQHYAGQIVINVTAGRGLFYWFFEADHPNASSLPLVLWLNGGPGCSSVGAGALAELGPFRLNSNATGLDLNPDSWNKAANLIFLEVPYNVGFSYTTLYSDNGFYTDNTTAADSLLFLLEFLKKFPEYKNNEFYVTGESFAGHYIPTLASQIIAYNSQGSEPAINFKGFAIGNPSTDDKYDVPGNYRMLYTHSVISREVYERHEKYCALSGEEASSICSNASLEIRIMAEYIDPYNILKPICTTGSGIPPRRTLESLTVEELAFEQRRAVDPCTPLARLYLNLPEVQAALNVATRPVDWRLCNRGITTRNYLGADLQRSMLPVYRELFKSGLRILIYSGDLDSVVSTLSTRAWIEALNLTVIKPWYAWEYKEQVGGWAEIYSDMTFTTVRGSGHMPPVDTPGQALFIFQKFLQGNPLPGFT